MKSFFLENLPASDFFPFFVDAFVFLVPTTILQDEAVIIIIIVVVVVVTKHIWRRNTNCNPLRRSCSHGYRNFVVDRLERGFFVIPGVCDDGSSEGTGDFCNRGCAHSVSGSENRKTETKEYPLFETPS